MRREGQASSITGTQWEVVSALAVTIDRDWRGRGKRIVSGGGSAGVPLAQGLLRKGGMRIQPDERGEDGTSYSSGSIPTASELGRQIPSPSVQPKTVGLGSTPITLPDPMPQRF